ncbi:MAG: hypothetical protein Q8T13_02210 [Acidobacteriota bacterium]|nr:hypothetical protein [Acidobacteriota bacterium]
MNKCQGARVLLAVLVLAYPVHAQAQGTAAGDRVMAVVRAAVAPALPYPDTDDTGSMPANNSPVPLWMVRPLQPGERIIEVLANPLNEVNQTRAARAMALIGAAVEVAQRRAELQYEHAVAEAKRTGRSQDVDGVSLSDEGVAGARIDAEAHVTIDVDFNQPAYAFGIDSGVAPAPSRQVAIAGAVAVITTPSNVFRTKGVERTEEKYCAAEALVYFGAVSAPEVRERSEHAYQVTATAVPGGTSQSVIVRLRGNEALISEILVKTDWHRVQELLK